MTDPKNKSRHLVLFQVVTPLVALLFAALLLEIGLRIAGYDPTKGLRQSDGSHEYYLRLSNDPRLRYEPNPGFRGELALNKVKMRINALGLRGRELKAGKEGRFRIALLGDSIAFAKDFQEIDIFPVKLEMKLQVVDPNVEVLNLGVEGYDTLEEVARFQKVGRPLKPDVAVVCFCLNDIGVTALDTHYLTVFSQPRLPLWTRSRLWTWIRLHLHQVDLKKDLRREFEALDGFAESEQRLYPPVETDDFLAGQFRLIEEAQRTFSASKGDKRRAVAERNGDLWLKQYLSLKNLGKIRYAFGELKSMAEKDGFKVLVAVIPFFYRIDGAYLDRPAHTIVLREAERFGFKAVDLYDAFAARGLESLTRDGVHLNPAGHAVMTAVLFRELRAWLPAMAGPAPKTP